MNELLEQPRQIRKFNPGTFQSDVEVTSQFVVRNRELGVVLDVLRGNAGSPSCQHVLLVGPRGRGKTMLLARIAAELRTDGDLSDQLLPIRFTEESHEIFNLGDFWLESLFYLARERGVRDPDLARELRDVHAALAAERHGRELEERARAAVLEIADRLGKRLVLMVENLQALCRDADDDFGWKLRGVLQSEPQIILLATATSRFRELEDAEHAFFELFRIVRLEPLDTGECRRLWQMVTGDDVREREIRPLQILTGGDPRLLVIIGGFAQHRPLGQLMEDLVRLIDDHTEYFRAHLEGFAKTERRVYLALIDLWQPSTTGEIAARARLDVRPVSALLGRLVERGAVVVEGNGKKRVYVAAQRLYSIYYKLRRERDEAHAVRNLVRFMAVFYTEDELPELQAPAGAQTMISDEALFIELDRRGLGWWDRLGRTEVALHTCEEVERRVGVLAGIEQGALERRARWVRTRALLLLEQHTEAMDVFRSVYAVFVPGEDTMVGEMLEQVPNLIAAGASERDLVGVLSSESEKTDALMPLVVALRQRAGEVVRAPVEVLEIAADIRREIETKLGSGDDASLGASSA